MLVYHSDELTSLGYTNSDFESKKNSRKSTSKFMFTLGNGTVSWISVK